MNMVMVDAVPIAMPTDDISEIERTASVFNFEAVSD